MGKHPRLTGYRFVCLLGTLLYLVAKSALSFANKGEISVASADLIYGFASAVGLLWLGLYEEEPGCLAPWLHRWLFHIDLLAPRRKLCITNVDTASDSEGTLCDVDCLVRDEENCISEVDITDLRPVDSISMQPITEDNQTSEVHDPSQNVIRRRADGTRATAGASYSSQSSSLVDSWTGCVNGKVVNVKVTKLFSKPGDIASLAKSFAFESARWTQVQHPNIEALLGVDSRSLAPEWCLVASSHPKSENLVDYLRHNPRADRISTIVDIADGLSYLHDLDPSILHGSLSGANVIVTDSHRALLTNFGLMAFSPDTLDTSSDAVRWAAPEILAPDPSGRHGRITTSSDTYSFALTVVEVLTGTLPFAHISDNGLVVLAACSGARPLRPAGSGDELWDLIEDCWEQSPDLRPPMREVTQRLRELQRSGSLSREDTTSHVQDVVEEDEGNEGTETEVLSALPERSVIPHLWRGPVII